MPRRFCSDARAHASIIDIICYYYCIDHAFVLCRTDKASSDMSVDEDSSSSEEGEKDSSSDSDSGSDSESNDENCSKKQDALAPVSPPQQEEQEEEQPRWYLKNFLKKSTPDTNNTTRTSQQVGADRLN